MNKTDYDHKEIEKKWQSQWEIDKVFSPDLDTAKKPYYNLMMFPYPSAEGLHVGNMYAFTGADVYARFNRMQGKDVFEPIGLDGFGIHSENYAIKIGKNPKEQAKVSQENYYRQLRNIGNSFDWSRTLETYDPLYYRWTQWLFIQLFKAGLAYRKKAEVNWCPSCKTVLSDEQVIDGKCERCSSIVKKKELEQWFFKITDYAERLLNNIEGLDWTEKVKIAQRNWIGKSEGLIFTAPVKDTNLQIDTFSAHFEAFYADTFVVIAPDHPFLKELIEGVSNKKEIEDFCSMLLDSRKKEKPGEEKEPEGIFTGRYIVDPVGNGDLPIWVANFALKDYGTGIVKCSAHDVRDFAFAKKYNIKLKPVLFPEDQEERSKVENLEICYTDMKNGVLVEPEEFNGKKAGDVSSQIVDYAQNKGFAKRHSTYHLRDWLISRQRYWGPPIPMVYCQKCASEGKSWFTTKEASSIHNSEFIIQNSLPGWYSVPFDDLPVLLPDVEDWRPDPSAGSGQVVTGPLANHPEFYEVKCPECGGEAKRETDVSDTFLDSAWYFLRYPSLNSTNSAQAAFDPEITRKWLPVAKYIGGAEHSVLHLLYSRFISMVLHDLKLVDFEEPFTSFFAHGLIIKDGAKMSKSKGNVVVPDTYIEKYGADTLRSYLMFLGPFSDGGDFRDSGIEGMNRFLKRVWRLIVSSMQYSVSGMEKNTNPELDVVMHKTIKGVTEDIHEFKYNTAIAKLMEYYNALNSYYTEYKILDTKYCKSFLLLLAPFAPFMTEELYQNLEGRMQNVEFSSIHLSSWPEYDEKYLVSDEVVIVVQVNGRKRSQFTVHSSELNSKEKVEAEAKELIKSYIENIEIKKIIYVPGKIINFVI